MTYDELRKFIDAAPEIPVEPSYWINGASDGELYCYDHAVAECDRLTSEEPEQDFEVDGGVDMEDDSQGFCAICGITLGTCFSYDACESELEHFEKYGFDLSSRSDLYSAEQILSAQGTNIDNPLIHRLLTVCQKSKEGSNAS